MNHEEIYERAELEITPFDAEDIITTSGEGPLNLDDYEVAP